jgi:uncharacterized protein YqjF (DUF2071 family)
MDGKWTKRIDYSTRRIHPGAQVGGCRVIYEPGAAPRLAANDPLEAFLIERYRLFAFRKGEIWTGMVRHQPYEVRSAKVVALEETLLFAAGVRRPDIEPLVHYAREVIVDIGPLEH